MSDVPDGCGVLVRILRVGLDGTDREINAGEYGALPEGSDFLVLGHESLGVVEQVGPAVVGLAAGDYVVARVRRAGTSLYDLIDTPDMTTGDAYFEHGISRVNGFLTERYVEGPRYLSRCRLASMVLRYRGLQVTTYGLTRPPYLNSDLVEGLGAQYVSTEQTSLTDDVAAHGSYDLVFDATGYSPIVFEAMCHTLAKNGVLVLASVTGGMRRTDVPTDGINLDFVLGNRFMFGTVNAGREHFEEGVRDMAVAQAQYPGWLAQLLTHPVDGLQSYEQALSNLSAPGVIKTLCADQSLTVRAQ